MHLFLLMLKSHQNDTKGTQKGRHASGQGVWEGDNSKQSVTGVLERASLHRGRADTCLLSGPHRSDPVGHL